MGGDATTINILQHAVVLLDLLFIPVVLVVSTDDRPAGMLVILDDHRL